MMRDQFINRPADVVITRLKEMINSGALKPGDKLPAERRMASDFGVGRTQIREALHKLEFYGIIKTLPQSGSVLNGLDLTTLNGLISDVIDLQQYDFYSLVETRLVLEETAVRLCAERRTSDDIQKLEEAHAELVRNFDTPQRVSYDFAFHRAIAESCHNPVIKAMLLIVTPDILSIYQRDRICAPNRNLLDEHFQMLEAIRKGDADKASELMRMHLKGVVDFAKSKK